MPSFFSISTAKDFNAFLGTTQYVRIAVILFVLILAVGYGAGFAIGVDKARKKSEDDDARLLTIYTEWQMDVITQFTRAESLAMTAATYALATAEKPANLSAPSLDRIVINKPDAFDGFCDDVSVRMPGIYSVMIVSGGVIAQTCPKGSVPVGFDMLNSSAYVATFEQMFAKGEPIVTGPTNMATVQNGVSITAWYPIFLNSSNVVRTRDTFWGTGAVIMELNRLVETKNIDAFMDERDLSFALWYESYDMSLLKTTGQQVVAAHTLIVSNTGGGIDTAAVRQIINGPYRVRLPAAEVGKSAFFGFYPRKGRVLPEMSTAFIAGLSVGMLLADVLIISCLFLVLYVYFLFRHRKAPARDAQMFISALTLRGAQPIADRAPLEAVRMFNDFVTSIRAKALEHGCYPVCEVGDRTVYVAAKTPSAVMALARQAVFDVTIQGNAYQQAHINAADDDDGEHSDTQHCTATHRSQSHATSAREHSRSKATNTKYETTTAHSSSFISSAVCRPSAAIHAVTSQFVYDADKDRYFFGNAAQLGKLCSALDGTKGGEVGWTVNVEDNYAAECNKLRASAVSSHIVSEGNDITLHVASLWKETGDERDNEDPSVAMAALSDAYVKRMTVIVSQGKALMAKKKKGSNGGGSNGGSGSQTKGSSNKSADATAITRNATILHIAILDENARIPLDVVRRIVAEEKGAVVSGHENILMAAFNLLSPGGHHQVRAADAVLRIRSALTTANISFVCSLHYGKVNALVIDGLVLCSGDAVKVGRQLLEHAIALKEANIGNEGGGGGENSSGALVTTPNGGGGKKGFNSSITDLIEKQIMQFDNNNNTNRANSVDSSKKIRRDAADGNGLCLLYAVGELSSTHECEAVDVSHQATATANRKPVSPVRATNKLNSSGKGNASVSEDSDSEPNSNARNFVNSNAGGGGGELKKSRIVYRLADRKSGKDADDEWMYRLKDEEDQSPFAAVNAVFNCIAAGDVAEAGRIWAKVASDAHLLSEISTISQQSIQRHLAAIMPRKLQPLNNNTNNVNTNVNTNNIIANNRKQATSFTSFPAPTVSSAPTADEVIAILPHRHHQSESSYSNE